MFQNRREGGGEVKALVLFKRIIMYKPNRQMVGCIPDGGSEPTGCIVEFWVIWVRVCQQKAKLLVTKAVVRQRKRQREKRMERWKGVRIPWAMNVHVSQPASSFPEGKKGGRPYSQ